MEHPDEIAADDWVDQDLLTKDEAGRRLEDEIAVVAADLARLGRAGAGPREQAEIDLLSRRLEAMRAARAELKI